MFILILLCIRCSTDIYLSGQFGRGFSCSRIYSVCSGVVNALSLKCVQQLRAVMLILVLVLEDALRTIFEVLVLESQVLVLILVLVV